MTEDEPMPGEECQMCNDQVGRQHQLVLSGRDGDEEAVSLRLCSECRDDIDREDWVEVEAKES